MAIVQSSARYSPTLATMSLAILGSLIAFSADAVTLSGSATLTSDYVWRGSSQNQGHIAAQSGLKATWDKGFYGSWWGSSVNFGGQVNASTELDGVVGWSKDLSPIWNLDANLTRYQYPGSHVNLNWTELGSTLTWKNTLWLQLGLSNDAMASKTSGSYSQLGFRLPLSDTVRMEFAAEHYFLSHKYADDYSDGEASVIWSMTKNVGLRLTGHVTDQAAKRLFPGQAGSRIELALQANF